MTSHFIPTAATAAALFVGGWVVAGAAAAGPPPTTTQQPAPVPGHPPATPSQAPRPRPPASSLTRPESPSKAPDASGFIRRWLVLEPIAVPPQLDEAAIQTLVKHERFAGQRTAMPSPGQRVAIGDREVAWHAVDTLGYNLNLYHFAYALGQPTSNVLFWVVTVVDAPRELPGVRLAIGSNAASVWWLNDEEVIGLYNDRQSVIDDGVSKRVTLKKGPNVIRAAIVNGGGATDFCARFLDEAGNPVKGFTTRSTTTGATR